MQAFSKCENCGERHPTAEQVKGVILWLAELIKEQEEEDWYEEFDFIVS